MTTFAYLVTYDVADDGRRVRVAEQLLDLGAKRLQRSVFWLVTDGAGLVRMRRTLAALIDHSFDRVHWYRVCGNCPGIKGRTRAAILPSPSEDAPAWIV